MEHFRKVSIQMKNDFESRRKSCIIAWNGKEYVPSDAERILVGYEHIHENIECILLDKESFPCFDECVHFRFFHQYFSLGKLYTFTM